MLWTSAPALPGAWRSAWALRRITRLGFYVLVSAMLLPIVFPVLWMFLSALKPLKDLVTVPPTVWPRHPTLKHFRDLIALTNFPIYMLNSTLTAFLTTGITIAVATLGAYSLTRFQYRGRQFLATFTLLSYMFPPLLLAIPLFVVITRLGMGDSLVSLAFAHISFALPFCLWLMRSSPASIRRQKATTGPLPLSTTPSPRGRMNPAGTTSWRTYTSSETKSIPPFPICSRRPTLIPTTATRGWHWRARCAKPVTGSKPSRPTNTSSSSSRG